MGRKHLNRNFIPFAAPTRARPSAAPRKRQRVAVIQRYRTYKSSLVTPPCALWEWLPGRSNRVQFWN